MAYPIAFSGFFPRYSAFASLCSSCRSLCSLGAVLVPRITISTYFVPLLFVYVLVCTSLTPSLSAGLSDPHHEIFLPHFPPFSCRHFCIRLYLWAPSYWLIVCVVLSTQPFFTTVSFASWFCFSSVVQLAGQHYLPPTLRCLPILFPVFRPDSSLDKPAPQPLSVARAWVLSERAFPFTVLSWLAFSPPPLC